MSWALFQCSWQVLARFLPSATSEGRSEKDTPGHRLTPEVLPEDRRGQWWQKPGILFLGGARSLDPSTETSLDPSRNGTGCHRKQDPSGDSHLPYGRRFVPVLDRRGARRGLSLFFLCTLLAYSCCLLGAATVSVPGHCLSVLPPEGAWWQDKARRWWREERARETGKVLRSYERAGVSVEEKRRELWGRAVSVLRHGFAKRALAAR